MAPTPSTAHEAAQAAKARGLERVAGLLVADEERRGEHVAGAGRVHLRPRQRRHVVDAVAREQREPAPAAREGDDRARTRGSSRARASASGRSCSREEEHVDAERGRAPAAPSPSRETRPVRVDRAHVALGDRADAARLEARSRATPESSPASGPEQERVGVAPRRRAAPSRSMSSARAVTTCRRVPSRVVLVHEARGRRRTAAGRPATPGSSRGGSKSGPARGEDRRRPSRASARRASRR